MPVSLVQASTNYITVDDLWDGSADYTLLIVALPNELTGYLIHDIVQFDRTDNASRDRVELQAWAGAAWRLNLSIAGSGESDSANSAADLSYTEAADGIAIVLQVDGNDVTVMAYDLATATLQMSCTASLTDVSARSAMNRCRIGRGGGDNFYGGHFGPIRVWQRALSTQEIRTEIRSLRAVSRDSLHADWPLLCGNSSMRVADFSGHGYDLTFNGTISDGTISFPLAWGDSGPVMITDAGGGGGGSPVEVIPTTASLTLTTYAPDVTASADVSVTPTTASLTVTGFAPTVTATDHVEVVPTTASLTLTTYAPTVTATEHVEVVPTTAALTLTPFAPGVSTTANVEVVPTTAALTLTPFAPDVTASNSIEVVPTTAALTLTTFAPTVAVSGNVEVVPGTATLSLTGYAPSINTGSVTATPTTAGLEVTTYAPTVSAGPLSAVSSGAWALSSGSIAASLQAGDEWRVTMSGPSANNVKARVTVAFKRTCT